MTRLYTSSPVNTPPPTAPHNLPFLRPFFSHFTVFANYPLVMSDSAPQRSRDGPADADVDTDATTARMLDPSDAPSPSAQPASDADVAIKFPVDKMPDKVHLETPSAGEDQTITDHGVPSKNPAEPKKTTLNLGSKSPDPSADSDAKRHVPTIPIEILSRIATHLSKRDQAICARACKDFFQPFGEALWRVIILQDIPRLDDPSIIANWPRHRLFLYESIRVLSLSGSKADEDKMTAVISAGCTTSLRTITMREPTYYIQEPTTWLACAMIPESRDIKAVYYEHGVGAPFGLFESTTPCIDVDGTSRSWHDCASEVVIHYSRPSYHEQSGYWTDAINQSRISHSGRLRSVTLVFQPLTFTEWRKRVFFNDVHVDYDFVPDKGRCLLRPHIPAVAPPGHLDIAPLGHDFCFSLAFVCVTLPVECTISIVNTDQADAGDCRFIPSKTGDILEYTDHQRYPPSAAQGMRAMEGAQYINTRLTKMIDIVKRWVERLLQDAGKEAEAELDQRLANIKFITLKEYMAQPGRRDEWEGAPYVKLWL